MVRKKIGVSLAATALALGLGMSGAGSATAASVRPAVVSPLATVSCGGHTTNEPITNEYSTNSSAVYVLQCLLNLSLYYVTIAEDGSFGPATLAAVKRFQTCDDLTVDGSVGPQTWPALVSWANSTGWVDYPCDPS
ncbi:putative peptidoglycan binding protein [Streptomyces sp. 846.5]|nr:peptidoglycan-binding domain-containing protein [Streptomyces sp. 846.5]TDU02138.1 putative peptidoglycan binding protein [Streptomyces sp. 846.5]